MALTRTPASFDLREFVPSPPLPILVALVFVLGMGYLLAIEREYTLVAFGVGLSLVWFSDADETSDSAHAGLGKRYAGGALLLVAVWSWVGWPAEEADYLAYVLAILFTDLAGTYETDFPRLMVRGLSSGRLERATSEPGLVVGLAVVTLTKFADLASTWLLIGRPGIQEMNPIARWGFASIGLGPTLILGSLAVIVAVGGITELGVWLVRELADAPARGVLATRIVGYGLPSVLTLAVVIRNVNETVGWLWLAGVVG